MTTPDPVLLTQELIKFKTINPPRNEQEVAECVGAILSGSGFQVDYAEPDENRLNVIASKGLMDSRPPIAFTGHLDVVPELCVL